MPRAGIASFDDTDYRSDCNRYYRIAVAGAYADTRADPGFCGEAYRYFSYSSCVRIVDGVVALTVHARYLQSLCIIALMTWAEFHRWIIAAILAMARIGGAFAICPALTESMIPGVARRASTLGFAFLAIAYIHYCMPPGEPVWWLYMPAVLKEVAIGFLMGFFAAVPFWIAENVGNFIDNQRGATMGEVYSPLSGAQVSTTGIFFTQLVSTIFFSSGAILLLLGALYRSYMVWPVFGPAFTFAPDTPVQILGALDEMLKTTVVISAPAIIVMFLATLGLGLVNRTAPQLNVFFLSMPVKSALGIAMLIVYLPFILDMLMYTDESALLSPLGKIIGGT